MSKSKNILFITHHNNDFDHFLPLIVHLKKDKEIRVKILAFYSKHELLKNRLHKYICDSNDINLDSMTDISYFKLINKAVIKTYGYVITHRKLSYPGHRIIPPLIGIEKSKREDEIRSKITKGRIVNSIKSPGDAILRSLEFVLIRYLVLCSIFLLTDKKMLNYIDSNKIDLAIIDQRRIDESLVDTNPVVRFMNSFTRKTDPMNHVLFRFTKRVRERNIPIFMMPHGPQPVSKRIEGMNEALRRKQLKNPFRPDFLVICTKNDLSITYTTGNENEPPLFRRIQGIKSTLPLGDPRFDIDWINYLESCALKAYGSIVKKPKDKTVLLYLMDLFIYSSEGNQEYKLEMHKDILSLVNHFPNLEVWAKHHPRYVFEIPIDDFIRKDRQKNVKQFGNDTDTNILLAKADICLSASSTAFVSPILQRKPVIFYDRWKEKLPDATSIYDDLKFKASSREELVVLYKKIIDGEYAIDDSFLESFYKNVFSADSLSESMVEKYSEKIKEIVA